MFEQEEFDISAAFDAACELGLDDSEVNEYVRDQYQKWIDKQIEMEDEYYGELCDRVNFVD